MVIDKTYRGQLTGSGVGQMISKRIEGGTSLYYAIEEFTGSIEDRQGAFTLVHHGRMSRDEQMLDVSILEGSGSGDLAGISGMMLIKQGPEGHQYELQYELEAG